ncbi:hypothetical protein EWM64_g10190, partial [Hericium alpestre]
MALSSQTRPSSMTRIMDLPLVAQEVYGLADSDEAIAPLVKEALGVIEEALDRHGYDHVALSFNGGKDCKLSHATALRVGSETTAQARSSFTFTPARSRAVTN